MRKGIKYILLLLTMLLILGSLFACNNNKDPSDGGESDSMIGETPTEGQETPTDSEETEKYRYSLADFSVVRPQGSNTVLNDAMGRFYEYLVSLGNEDPTVTDDYGLAADSNRKEILLGLTNQPESEEAKKLLSHAMKYAIVFHENKIVIVATSDFALSEAVDVFYEEYLSTAENGVLSVEKGHSVVEKADVQEVTLYQNNKIRYNIVLPSKAGDGDEEIAALIEERLEQYTGNYPDRVYAGMTTYNENTYSILIGDVGYPECEQAYAGLERNEYAVRVVGNKLIVAGHYAMTRKYACEILLREMKDVVDAASKEMTLYVTKQWKGENTRFLWDFPEFTEGVNELEIDNENQTLMFSYTGVKKAEFTAYCQKIVADGYTLWQENQIVENLFRTYRDGKKELCLSFYPKQSGGTMHLFADEHKATAMIPDASQDYEKVTEATLHVMSLHYDHRGDYHGRYDGHGMNYVITLEDGRYIVMDGGYSSNAGSRDDERIYNYLVEHNRRKDGKVIIAAWFMSHPHGDHCGAFESFVSKYHDKVTLEYFIANPNSLSMASDGSWYFKVLPGLLTQMNAPLIKPHTGQIVTFCNTELEVVFTHENLYPGYIEDSNNTSTVIRLRQNGYTALFTGDASVAACDKMVKLYGDELKSDIFQVNHHGHSGGTWALYDAATRGDSYVLWTCAKDTFYYRTLGYRVEGKTIASSGILKPNRDLALKVGFENCFYADGVVEQIIFPLNGEITFVGERDYTQDPTTLPRP